MKAPNTGIRINTDNNMKAPLNTYVQVFSVNAQIQGQTL